MAKNIYFIDQRVKDYQKLIAGLPSDADWYLINSDEDGVQQIQNYLIGKGGYDSLQIISHGTEGALYLGNTILSGTNIGNFSAQLAGIGQSLTDTGDILLYGCNVAAGDVGMQFIGSLAQATGADVAASSDLTGATLLNGDWDLEISTSLIEASAMNVPDAQYSNLLSLNVTSNTLTYPEKSLGEYRNYYCFAALRADGSVVTWGDSISGGDSSAVASQIDGTIDVVQVFSAQSAFAALRSDGSVVTWGGAGWGGDSSAVASQIDGTIDVVQVFSAGTAFAALRSDGSVVTWGSNSHAGNSSSVLAKIDGTVDVLQISSTYDAFAALRVDGSIVTWGNPYSAGNSDAVAGLVNGDVDVIQVYSTDKAFAALRSDGSVVTWGDVNHGGDSSAVASQLDGSIDVVQIFATHVWTGAAFAALRSDGSVVTWGDVNHGGDSSAVASQLDGSIDVVQVVSTQSAFAAIRTDGSVVTWGENIHGGDSSTVASLIDGSVDVIKICAIQQGFAALRADGSVVTWGLRSVAMTPLLDGTINVTQIFFTDTAFAALREDGSVVTWGGGGGDSSAASTLLDGTVDVIHVFSSGGAFAALRADGSVVTWGNSNGGGDSSAVASQIDGTIDVVWMANPFTDDRYNISGQANPDDYADEATDATAPIGILNLGSPITATIGPADTDDTYGDKDVFKVSLTSGQTYQIHLQSTAVNGLPLGIFTVRDPGNFDTVLNTSAIGADVTSSFTATTTGDYYIRVGTGGAATDQGGYQLSLNSLTEWAITSIQSSVAEDNGSATFIITRPSSSGNQTVYVSTTAIYGFANNSDYTSKVNEAVIFLDGEQTKSVTVNITPDSNVESNETFGLIVQQATVPDPNVYLAKNTFTILNDDNAGWFIDPASAEVNERDKSLIFSITRPAGGETQTVYVSTVDDQGFRNDHDYTGLLNYEVTFFANEKVRPVRLAINSDFLTEPSESFNLSVRQAPNDSVESSLATATFTITNDSLFAGGNPSGYSSNEIFTNEKIGSKVYFLSLMSEAAYALATDEPRGDGLNSSSHGLNAQGERAIVSEFLQLLTPTDLPSLALTDTGGNFPTTGLRSFEIDSGIYTNKNAAALVGRSEDALFVAFRGTNDDVDQDHWVDLPGSDPGMSDHFALFAPLLSELQKYIDTAANGIKTVYVTGHSLGAAMVQAYMAEHLGDPRFQAITFASPGYSGFDEIVNFDYADSRISNIHIAYDPILLALNVSNKERGDDYLITHEANTVSTDLHAMDAYLAIAKFIAENNLQIPNPTSGHDKTFDVSEMQLSLSQDSQGHWVVDFFSGPIYGNDANNFLFSGSGSDVIYGGGGNDFIHSGDGNDAVSGEGGADIIKAGTGGGNDYYDGGDDTDTVMYTSTSRGIIVNLSLSQDQGKGLEIDIDQIVNVENVTGGSGKDTLIGSYVDNVLDGSNGADKLTGGGGNDTYVVDNPKDKITEKSGLDSGTDEVQSSISYKLGSNLENLTLTGTDPINGTGNELINTLKGNSNNNILDGGKKVDIYIGGDGNDTFLLDDINETDITEYAGEGTDTIKLKSNAAGTYDMADSIEDFVLLGNGLINITGNAVNNTITGNAKANQLDGGAGNDILIGGKGDDILLGGIGDDSLYGGAGKDTLTGGDGADTFIFNIKPGASNVDTITDFTIASDKLALDDVVFKKFFGDTDLSDNFQNITTGSKATEADNFLLYDSSTGSLYYDVDGSGAKKAVLVGVFDDGAGNHSELTATDFVIV